MTTTNTTLSRNEDNTAAELAAVQETLTELRNRTELAESRYQKATRRARFQAGLAFAALTGAIFLSPGNRTAIAQTTNITLQNLANRLSAVEGKTRFMSSELGAKTTTFSGCNVIINNGGGSTAASVTTGAGAGLGNLIIGYNATRGTDTRTGSHNLILGDQNDYSSYGGLVAGQYNSVSAPYASISGGYGGIASGFWATIHGGVYNTASGYIASVSSGYSNTASGAYASVSGGAFNAAIGDSASVSGGYGNLASGLYASVSGGAFNTANMNSASVSGGYGITQANDYGWSAASYHNP